MMPGDIFDCPGGGGVGGAAATGIEWVEAGLLHSILQCTDRPSQPRVTESEMSVVLSLRSPALHC